jgi:hypothetical protein
MLMSDQTDALTVARERIVHEAVEQTGALDLSGLDLTVLPEEVSRLKHLREFNCSSTQVSDLSPLAGLSALQIFCCSETKVSDLFPLAGLTTLQFLDCAWTLVIDLTPLDELTELQTLDCGHTQVSTLLPLTAAWRPWSGTDESWCRAFIRPLA